MNRNDALCKMTNVYEVIKNSRLDADKYPQWIREYIDVHGLRNLHDYGLKPYLRGLTDAADRNTQNVYNKSELSAMLTPTNKPTSKPVAGPTVEPVAGPTVEPVAGPTVEPVAGPTASDYLMYPGLEECFREKKKLTEETLKDVPGSVLARDAGKVNASENGKGYKLGTFARFKDFLMRHKTAIGLSAIGCVATAAAVLSSIALLRQKNNKSKSKKERLKTEKRAFFENPYLQGTLDFLKAPMSSTVVQSSRANPAADLLYNAFTARTPEDYKKVNEQLENLSKKNDGAGGGIGFTFDEYSWRPGDNVLPTISALTTDSQYFPPNVSAMQAWDRFTKPVRSDTKFHTVKVVDENGNFLREEKEGDVVDRPNLRLAPLAYLAAGMLPGGKYEFKKPGQEHPIGLQNAGYLIPFAIGQYAEDRGMSNDEVHEAYRKDGAKLTADAISDQVNKYPLLRNFISAYINGGFGRVNSPKEFGLADRWWDYAAQAPTPAGTNAVSAAAKAAREELWRNMVSNRELGKEVEEKLKTEMLRTLDRLGPEIFMPNTYLGRELLTHPDAGIYGTIDKLVPIGKKYYDADSNVVKKLIAEVPPDVIARAQTLKARGEEFAKNVDKNVKDLAEQQGIDVGVQK